MDGISWVILAVMMAVAGYWTGRGVTAEPTEAQMLERLIKMRTDRYIGAVAKLKVDEEIKAAATKQTEERLAEHGITPTR